MTKKIVGALTILGIVVGIIASVPAIKDFFFPERKRTFELTNSDLLSKLFGAKFVDNRGFGVWKKINEESDISVLKDERWQSKGYFYTKIENTFKYQTLDNQTRAIVVFATYNLNPEGTVDYSHMEAPLISLATFVKNPDETWTNTRFSRHCTINGTFGRTQRMELSEIGKGKLGLYLSSTVISLGNVITTTEIFDAEDLNEIFDYTAKAYYEGGYVNDSTGTLEGGYDVECKLLFDTTSRQEYYPFCLQYFGRMPKNITDLKEYYGIDLLSRNCFTYDYTSKNYSLIKYPGEIDEMDFTE